jgi:hypothetical protein
MMEANGLARRFPMRLRMALVRRGLAWAVVAGLSAGCGPAAPVAPTATLAAPTLAASPTVVPTPVPPTATPEPQPPILFDDFRYDDQAALAANGWVVRTAPGWPGVPGATWWPEGISFHDSDSLGDAASAAGRPGDRVVRLASATNGTGDGTRQSQLCQQRKFLEGTYAARLLFSDAPAFGPDGDQVVQTFYTISPLAADLDPDYSELDFEYLPNGGWGNPAHTFFFTTWETFRPEPNWLADNVSGQVTGSQAGAWRTVVLQVLAGQVRYFVDGVERAAHGDKFYPEVVMSINFNLWFIANGQAASREERQYEEYVDWVYHQAGAALSPDEVEAAVAGLRASGTAFVDTVPAMEPVLPTPCDF